MFNIKTKLNRIDNFLRYLKLIAPVTESGRDTESLVSGAPCSSDVYDIIRVMPAPPYMVARRMIYRLIRTVSADGIDTMTGPASA